LDVTFFKKCFCTLLKNGFRWKKIVKFATKPFGSIVSLNSEWGKITRKKIVLAPLFRNNSNSNVYSLQRSSPIRYGYFQQYIPKNPTGKLKMLVLCHGQKPSGETAKNYTIDWIDVSEKNNLIIVTPEWDRSNWGSDGGRYPGGGYRGNFGKYLRADVFLNQIVDLYKNITLTTTSKKSMFYLYGHSAGGQFVSRYIVMHPERYIAAAITAAGSYAWPDPNTKWPYGMNTLDDDNVKWINYPLQYNYKYNPEEIYWAFAATKKVAVIVGTKDTKTSGVPSVPGNKGVNRIQRGQFWINDMRTFARQNYFTPNIRFYLANGIGHNSTDLFPFAKKFLFSGPFSGDVINDI